MAAFYVLAWLSTLVIFAVVATCVFFSGRLCLRALLRIHDPETGHDVASVLLGGALADLALHGLPLVWARLGTSWKARMRNDGHGPEHKQHRVVGGVGVGGGGGGGASERVEAAAAAEEEEEEEEEEQEGENGSIGGREKKHNRQQPKHTQRRGVVAATTRAAAEYFVAGLVGPIVFGALAKRVWCWQHVWWSILFGALAINRGAGNKWMLCW
jgi:hypothetical protein